MSEDGEKIRQLETELGAIRARLKSEQAERLALWPKAELADTLLSLLRRSQAAVRRHRKTLVGVQLREADYLLMDIARAVQLIDTVDERVVRQNQPCFSCGSLEGATETPQSRFSRCNSCGYAG